MIFLGECAFGEEDCYSVPPVFPNALDSVVIKNGIFDELFVTKDINFKPLSAYPGNWDQTHVLHGTFHNGVLSAGNIDFAVNNTTDILIKRREKGTFNWQTIYQKEINSSYDFNFIFYDRYARSGITYQYGISQICGGVEGDTIIVECHSEFDGYYLVEKDQLFHLFLDLKLDRQRNTPRSFVTGLNKRFPDTILTSRSDYYSGSATATIMEFQTGTCDLDTKNASDYRDKFMDFLSDGMPKLLKTFDGKSYIINIDSVPSESTTGHWNLPSTSFNFVQVGSTENIKELVLNGLLDLDQKWWSV